LKNQDFPLLLLKNIIDAIKYLVFDANANLIIVHKNKRPRIGEILQICGNPNLPQKTKKLLLPAQKIALQLIPLLHDGTGNENPCFRRKDSHSTKAIGSDFLGYGFWVKETKEKISVQKHLLSWGDFMTEDGEWEPVMNGNKLFSVKNNNKNK